MSEREKGPGPTLPESVFVRSRTAMVVNGNRAVWLSIDHEAGERGHPDTARYVRADLAPDPERERLVEAVLKFAPTVLRYMRQVKDNSGMLTECIDIFEESLQALEAHDAKGEGP